AVGDIPDLHLVWQVRAGLSNRRDFPPRLHRRRDGARSLTARLSRHGAGEEAMDRLRFATVWLGGCSGCHMSFLDLDEWLFELGDCVDVVYSPLIDVKEYPEGVDVALVEGAVANEDNLQLIQRVRRNTRGLVSFGDCAVTGNVTALRNPLRTALPVLQ